MVIKAAKKDRHMTNKSAAQIKKLKTIMTNQSLRKRKRDKV
jgi:hypothetical protein